MDYFFLPTVFELSWPVVLFFLIRAIDAIVNSSMWNDGGFPSWAVCFSPALGHPKWKDLHQWLQTTLISDLWFLSNKRSSYFLYDPVIVQVLLWKTDCRRLGSTRIPQLKIWMCMPSQFILPSTDNIQMSWKTFLFLIFSMGDKILFIYYY